MAILYFVLRLWDDGIVRSIPFYITGCILSVLLTVQFSLMIGAIETKNLADGVEISINQLMEGETGIISANDSQAILNYLISRSPIIGIYVDTCDFTGNDTTTIATAMADTLRSVLNKYIFHRILWCVTFIVLACIIAALFAKGNVKQQKRHRGHNAPSRRQRHHVRSHDRI
ncbi:MAG: hypothetical protein MJY90_01600 [Bacteroidaceae bacterium]|nr:hypothetical protein [Bacteroidaceae bacterium]